MSLGFRGTQIIEGLKMSGVYLQGVGCMLRVSWLQCAISFQVQMLQEELRNLSDCLAQKASSILGSLPLTKDLVCQNEELSFVKFSVVGHPSELGRETKIEPT